MMSNSRSPGLPTASTLKRLVDAVYSLVDAVRRADWVEVDQGASIAADLGATVFSSAFESLRSESAAPAFEADARRWLAMWRDLAESGTAGPMVGEMRRRLPPELVQRYSQALDQLAAGGHADNRLLSDVTRTIERGAPRGERFVAGLGILGMSRGLLARMHVALNRPPGHGAAYQDSALERACRDFDQGLRVAATELYQVWADPEAVRHEAAALARFIERELPRFAAMQGAALRAIEANAPSHDQVKTRRSLLDASSIVRDAIAMHAGSYRAMLNARSPLGGPRRVPPSFDVEVHRGRRVAFSELSDAAQDELVTIEGNVRSITIVREDKLVTRLALDDEQGHGAELDVVFAHLAHAGLTEGARVRATGRVVELDAAGTRMVRAEQLDWMQLAEDAWVKLLISQASPWFHRWRNRANVDWSLGLHHDHHNRGGAAELVFSPLMRDGRI